MIDAKVLARSFTYNGGSRVLAAAPQESQMS